MDPILISAIAGAALLFFTRKKTKRGAPPIIDEPVPPPDEPNEPPPPSHDAQLLKKLGYGTKKSQIWSFQNEFNYVQREFHIWDRQLKRDGVIGVNTRGALIRADEYSKQRGVPWKDIVKEAKAKGAKYKFFVGGYNLPARGLIAGKLKNAGLDVTVMDQGDLAAYFYQSSWANADALIVAVDVGNDELARAWAAPKDAAGPKARSMTMDEILVKGVNQAISLGKS